MKPEIEKLLNHTSIRKYKDRPIEEDKKDIIIRSSQMAPTSSHYQSYSIIEIEKVETRKMLKEISGGQNWILEAPLVFLYCADLHRAEKYFEEVDSDALSNLEYYTVAVTDAALAAQKALITAQLLDLGGVFVGGIRNDVDRICQDLKLPDKVAPLFLLCLGYPDQEVPVKPRLPKEEILKQDYYQDENQDEKVKKYNEKVKNYYIERTKGKINETWTHRCGKAQSAKKRYNVGECFRKKGLAKK
ncbi:MAG: NADPH-dependent oxidoreductase [Eubacteriales bacterium]